MNRAERVHNLNASFFFNRFTAYTARHLARTQTRKSNRHKEFLSSYSMSSIIPEMFPITAPYSYFAIE